MIYLLNALCSGTFLIFCSQDNIFIYSRCVGEKYICHIQPESKELASQHVLVILLLSQKGDNTGNVSLYTVKILEERHVYECNFSVIDWGEGK